jgi:two-component system nitrogen regulation sensor histidine kinase NtrY
MVYKKLFIQTLVRVLFLVLTCLLFAFYFYRAQEEYYFLISGIGLLIILQAYLLVRYVNKSNSDLTILFNSIQSRDRSIYFPPIHQTADKNLRNALNRLIEQINSVETENEKRRIYLQTLIDQIDIGIISFDQDGKVDISNQAFRNLFHQADFKHLHDLNHIQANFSDLFLEISPRKSLLKKLVVKDSTAPHKTEILQLSIKANIIQSGKIWRKIITCHNIIHELEFNELDSWQKLIRVLTHEIMNSISPITSISHKIVSGFKKLEMEGMNPDIREDLIRKSLDGLNTIEETGKGLLDFVTKYRSLTLIPPPEPVSFPIHKLFHRLQNLFEEECRKGSISFLSTIDPEDLHILADEGQIEKAMINLIKNAIEAVKEVDDKKIELIAIRNEDDRIQIQVKDNGIGIPPENIEDIFIPFYTTKEKGSGIGLSLSRQIIRINGGTIKAFSMPGKETIFTVIM